MFFKDMVLDQKEIRGAESHSLASCGKHSNSHKELIRNISGFMSRRRTFHLLSAEPSKADRLITERLKQALELVDIRCWTTRWLAGWILCLLPNVAGCKEYITMKIISKRQAMAIYRQHPQSRLFRLCAGK